jgi:tRNA pseudouridine13 synthase
MLISDVVLDFPRAYGSVSARASFRSCPEDFEVIEELGFEPSGDGEHIYLFIEKRGENTAWVAEQIARIAQVKPMDVGYCGRKDRHAVTRQWFSIYLPLRHQQVEPDWSLLGSDSIQVISISRHTRKLRKGEHRANHFRIGLRDLQVDEPELLIKKLEHVFAQGVPNYFGEQRFGNNANNLREANALLVDGKTYRDKQKRGLILSAARSYLFNLVLAERVRVGNWNQLMDGDPQPEPSGPLWGRGRPPIAGELLTLEQSILSEWSEWCHGLEHMGLSQERRALVLRPSLCSYEWRDDMHLALSFTLESGAFATSLLHELFILDNQQQQKAIVDDVGD